MSNLLQKLIFDRVFYVNITDPDIESLFFFQTLFDEHFVHILVKFEQNRIVENIRNSLT